MPPSRPDTDALLGRIEQGDQAAVGELLDRHRARLARMVSVRMDERLAMRIDASDVVQEAMIIALQRLPEYLQDRPVVFYPWLRQIAWERLVELHRRHVHAGKRSVRREEPGLSDASSVELVRRIAASGTDPLGHLIRDELRARSRAALDRLGANDREILVLRHLEELTSAEAAAILGITEEAAIQRHVRALRRLRRQLGPSAQE
jgi:RNA polymerase sigma-70 factor, ECF subfamily